MTAPAAPAVADSPAASRPVVRPRRVITRRGRQPAIVHGTESTDDGHATTWCGAVLIVSRWAAPTTVVIRISNSPVTCKSCRRSKLGRVEP